MRALSKREHSLLMIGFAVLLTVGVYLPRIRPARLRAAALDEQRLAVENRIREAKWPRPPEDFGRLTQRRDALRSEVESARRELRQAERCFASHGGDALADELRLEISALAQRHGVVFREDVACGEGVLRGFVGGGPWSGTGSTVDYDEDEEIAPPQRSIRASRETAAQRLVSFLTLGDPYTLKARQVTLEADFDDLRGFLHGLDRLAHRVVVLRFDLTVRDRSPRTPAPLQATLAYAF